MRDIELNEKTRGAIGEQQLEEDYSTMPYGTVNYYGVHHFVHFVQYSEGNLGISCGARLLGTTNFLSVARVP